MNKVSSLKESKRSLSRIKFKDYWTNDAKAPSKFRSLYTRRFNLTFDIFTHSVPEEQFITNMWHSASKMSPYEEIFTIELFLFSKFPSQKLQN